MGIDVSELLDGAAPVGPLAGLTVASWTVPGSDLLHLERSCRMLRHREPTAMGIAFPWAGLLGTVDLRLCGRCVIAAVGTAGTYLRQVFAVDQQQARIRGLGHAVLHGQQGKWGELVELTRCCRELDALGTRVDRALTPQVNELHGFACRLVYEGLRRNDTAAGERGLLRPLAAALLTLPHAPLPSRVVADAGLDASLDGRLPRMVKTWFGAVADGHSYAEAERKLLVSLRSSAVVAARTPTLDQRPLVRGTGRVWAALVEAELDTSRCRPRHVVAFPRKLDTPAAPWLTALLLRYASVQVAPGMHAVVVPELAARWLAAGFGGVRARTLGPVGTRSTQDAFTAFTEGCRVDVFALPRDQARPDATHATASSAR